MVDVALIVIACVVPVVLLLLNVLIMAKYLDMQATAGHYIAKFFTVRELAPVAGCCWETHA